MNNLKLIFMGTPEFAVPCLENLVSGVHRVLAVVTAPDRPRGRGQKVKPSPVKITAQQYSLPVLQPVRLSDEAFIRELKSLAADLFVVVGFRILPPEVFTIPAQGTINLHASLLPQYRGAAPINWAIINGESETGLTTFFIEEKVDTGNIILQSKLAIGSDETAGQLHDRLACEGAQILQETVNLIAAGNAPRLAQQGDPTRAPKINRELCEINWEKSASDIHNLVRGLSPYPGAFTYLGGQIVKIFRTQIIDSEAPPVPAGQVLKVDKNIGHIWVSAGGGGTIVIRELQLEGKRRMTTEEFLLGNPLTAGTNLGK